MFNSGPHGSREIESELFHPGPRFLLASFSRPALEREQELAEVALWLGLDDALGAPELLSFASEGATGKWLRALRRCEKELSSDVEVRELAALTRALELQAVRADRAGHAVPINHLWEDMSQELRASLGLPRATPPTRAKEKSGGGHATHSSTLRGRRWGNLRVQLSNALAHLAHQATPRNLLPRDVREAPTFQEHHYKAILDALAERSCGGLAVIAAPPGSGKSELALSYARHEARRYDHIFWLRATDRLQLEQDFFEMARILVKEPGGRGHLRREVFRILETTNRWLIIFNSVVDPAMLLPYLPWNPEGHKLCTYWADSPIVDSAWSTYLNVHPAPPDDPLCLLKPLTPTEATAFLSALLDQPADIDDLTALADRVSPSRIATVLALRWLNHSKESVTDYIGRWDALPAPGRSTNDESCAYRAARLALRGLSQAERWVTRQGDPCSREEAAADLLRRLAPYGAATLPEEILDDPDWKGGRSPLDDRRLAVLDELGLADRANRLPHIKYFAVNPIVRAVVEDELNARSLADNLTIASRTLLHLLQEPGPRDSVHTRLELLPHVEHLALLLAPIPRPPVLDQRSGEAPGRCPVRAIELHAYAAAGHLVLLRVRPAGERLRLIDEVVERYPTEIRRTLARAEQTWEGDDIPPAPDDYRFGRPMKRMSQLILSMRLDGHQEVARSLFQGVSRALEQGDSDTQTDRGEQQSNRRLDEAQLFFHGALACRDMDDLDTAESAVATARTLWRNLGDEQGMAAAVSVEAVLERDRGNLIEARRLAEVALASQRQLVDEVTSPSSRARIELARDLSLLGNISRDQGQLREALSLMGQAAVAWASVPRGGERTESSNNATSAGPGATTDPAYRSGLEINEVSALSRQASLRAVLGDIAKAERAALQAWRRAQAIYPRGHRKTTLILSETAEVMRLAGEVIQARDLHLGALEMSERLWKPDHRITMRIRSACAASLLDAGEPQAAFAELEYILDRPAGSTVGDRLARARVWSVLGRLLMDLSLSFDVADDRTELDLSRRALQHAQQLLDSVTDPGSRHPEIGICLLGQAELAIRHRHQDAVQYARDAHEVLRQQFADASSLTVLSRARLLRAVALTADHALGEVDAHQLRHESAALEEAIRDPEAVHTPADRLEVALAAIAADSVTLTGVSAGDAALGQTLYDDAREKLDAAIIKPLNKQVNGEPHQLVSRSYAELARLAHRFLGPRQRARNERERDRSKPVFNATHERLQHLADILRHEQSLLWEPTQDGRRGEPGHPPHVTPTRLDRPADTHDLISAAGAPAGALSGYRRAQAALSRPVTTHPPEHT